MRQPKTKKTALVQAVDLLARQEQSTNKLREKLRHRGYADEEIEGAIERLEEKHYLNDADACRRQFTFLYEESRQSVRQICAKLMQRGFDSTLVRECVPRDTYEREKCAALRCLALKFKPSADVQKMMQHLYTRGFDGSAIRAAVEDFSQEAVEE